MTEDTIVAEDIFEKYDLVDVDESIPIPTLPEKGLILLVGTSGSGKSTILRHYFGNKTVEWDDRPIYESFSSHSNAEKYLLACGLRTIPAWKRPYHLLSTGEQHRADCARLLDDKFEVFDEFTSVVDRNTAKALSYSLYKFFKNSNLNRLVVATCHFDIIEWLLPDAIYDTDKKIWLPRGSLQRPKIRISLCSCEGKAFWPIFQKYHYLNRTFNKSARAFVGFIENKPVVFTSILPMPNRQIGKAYRGHRTVVLPEFQGLGIGNAVSEAIGDYLLSLGYRFYSKTAHPAMGEHREKSPKWRTTSVSRKKRLDYFVHIESKYKNRYEHANRLCYSHEYIGESLGGISE